MHEVICFHCANTVQITPDDCLCMVCGEDLQHLLPVYAVVEYFRRRSQELSTHGDLTGALAEVERGLSFAESSDLHLLAAILAKQLAWPDKMRRHVSAIPVDDSLRSEAEWLLRSHQDRERALREAQQASRQQRRPPSHPSTAQGAAISEAASSSILDDLLGRSDGYAARTRQGPWPVLASLSLVVLGMSIVIGAWWWFGPGSLRHQLPGRNEMGSSNPDVVTPVTPSGSSASTSDDVGVDDPDADNVEVDNVEAAGAGASTAPTATVPSQISGTPVPEEEMQDRPLLPTPTPAATVAVPADLAQAQPGLGDRAERGPQQVVVIPSNRIDIRTYLREQGYSSLADLAIEANLQESTLLLQGVVHLDAQRRQLVEVAQTIPGIENVSTANLLLLPRATYVVQEGDTLWSVVYNIYGDVERLDELYEVNRDQLASPEALVPGMILQVPPAR